MEVVKKVITSYMFITPCSCIIYSEESEKERERESRIKAWNWEPRVDQCHHCPGYMYPLACRNKNLSPLRLEGIKYKATLSTGIVTNNN